MRWFLILATAVLLVGCDCDDCHVHDDRAEIEIEVEIDESILADLFLEDPVFATTTVELLVYDEHGFEYDVVPLREGINRQRYRVRPYEELLFTLWADGRYFGEIDLVNVVIDDHHQDFDIEVERDFFSDDIVVVVNGDVVDVLFDCSCLADG